MPGKLIKKVCLLGDSSVGKTSLLRKYVYDSFDDRYIATIGTKTVKKEMTVEHMGKPVDLNLMIWDILGQKEYRRIQSMSFQGTSGALMVADCTRPETVQSLRDYWVPELRKVAGHIPMVFLGNKVDLMTGGGFDASALGGLVAELGGHYMLTSAKTGENVENAFKTLAVTLVGGGRTMKAEVRVREAKMSPAEALDSIFGHFVEHYGQDTGFAMAVLRKQCNVLGIDVNAPTKAQMFRLIDRLADVEKDTLSPGQISKNRVDRRNFLLRM